MITQVKKKFWKRVSWLSFISIIAVLGDEFIKEGHILDPADVTSPFAHEFWVMILAVVCFISTYVSERRDENAEEQVEVEY